MDPRVGIFITMNPGYAGRTELPESVKALFRPVVVIVPDLQQICEIMLFSEGFLLAKVELCFVFVSALWIWYWGFILSAVALFYILFYQIDIGKEDDCTI